MRKEYPARAKSKVFHDDLWGLEIIAANPGKCSQVCRRRQVSTATGNDGKASSAPKINEFRNKFEKFGAPTSKLQARKPSIGSASAAAGPATTGNEAIDKACRDAREFAEQLQQQMTQLEQSRISERQQLVDKLERRDNEMKTVNEKNAAVSNSLINNCFNKS